MRSRSRARRDGVMGVLDIGTSKTVCMVVAPSSALFSPGGDINGLSVLGVGQQPSRGLKAGVVVDLDAAEETVRSAVAQAERGAGITFDEVVLAVACGRVKSSTFVAEAQIGKSVVKDADVERLWSAARSFAERDGRALLHANLISYRIDGANGIAEPHGLAGATLGADMHVVTADDAQLLNLVHVIERTYLAVVGVVPSPYCSSLVASTEEERRLGVACLDMGAGTTGVALFAEGHLVSTDVIPIGGHHVTSDLARALPAPLAEAERIKTLYGKVGRAAPDDEQAISYDVESENGADSGPTSIGRVREIISGRVASLFGQVAERIERSGVPRQAWRSMVLAGGACQVPGLVGLAAEMFGCPVRLARLPVASPVTRQFCSPAYATAMGLVRVAFDPDAGVRWNGDNVEAGSYLGRIGQWLRQSF